MRRSVVQPADLAGDALGELKSWLGISQPIDDAMLVNLLEASLAMCEAFIGRMPLSQLVEEEVPFRPGPCKLAVRPVRSLASLEDIASDGTRSPLAAEDYEFDIEPGGIATIEFASSGDGRMLAARVYAGLATDWSELAAPLRQGIIRLAAHHFRERDRPSERKSERSGIAAPASVTALWRPWRPGRLA